MMPAIAVVAVSFKKEIWIVLLSLGVIVSLPLVALVAVSGNNSAPASAGALYTGSISVTDTYDFGFCTYWAALRREQVGKPIPNNWGNANTWRLNALLAGYAVDQVPTVGAVMQTTAGALGHVAYVEGVNAADGSWTISEMNFKGWDETDSRTLRASDVKSYYFIH